MPDLSAEVIVRAMLSIYHKDTSGFDFIRALEQRTGMTFINEPPNAESVCYANSQAVRSEYKTSFTTADLWNYINNLPGFQKIEFNSHLKSILPKTKQQFWHIVYFDKD